LFLLATFQPAGSVYLFGQSSCKDSFQVNDPVTGAPNKALHGSIKIQAGDWYHLAYVYSDTTSYIYVNGTMSASQSGFSPSSKLNTTRLYNYFGRALNGQVANILLDEIKIFNRALSQAQINVDMNTVGVPSSEICTEDGE
jgi:hypothetical protein